MERNPYSELTHEVLSGREERGSRRDLIEKISRIVYSYPKKHLKWDDDDVGDFFCTFFPKIEGIIDRFIFTGKPFEAYLASSIRWQLKTFAKKKAMQRAEDRVIKEESQFWYMCDLQAQRCYPIPGAGSLMVEDHQGGYSAEVSRVLRIESDGRIGDPAWARRFLYLLLRNVTIIDDSLLEHAAGLSGFEPDYILGCATELRERLEEKKNRCRLLSEKRNTLYIRILQLAGLMSEETESGRRSDYQRQIGLAKNRIKKIDRDLQSSSFLPTHMDIAEVLGVAKGSVDSGLYYLRKAFSACELN